MSYASETGVFTIQTDDGSLIDGVFNYKLTVQFVDYLVFSAGKYEVTSTVTYLSPCADLLDPDVAYTSMSAVTGAFTADDYSNTVQTINVESLFTVSPAFCDETITYTCTVSGVDSLGVTTNYGGTDYPQVLCDTLNNEMNNDLSVLADSVNYASSDTDLQIVPGTYTFTIRGTTTGGDFLDTTITWVLNDPCPGATISMDPIVASSYTYVLGDQEDRNLALQAATASIGVCVVSYTLTSSENAVDVCINDVNQST